jgi:hypothetical protein
MDHGVAKFCIPAHFAMHILFAGLMLRQKSKRAKPFLTLHSCTLAAASMQALCNRLTHLIKTTCVRTATPEFDPHGLDS